MGTNLSTLISICAGVILSILSNWLYDLLKDKGVLPSSPTPKRLFVTVLGFFPFIILVALPALVDRGPTLAEVGESPNSTFPTASRSNTTAVITSAAGVTYHVPTNFLVYDGGGLHQGLPLSNGSTIPFNRMRSFDIEADASYLVTATITLLDNTQIKDQLEGYAGGVLGPTETGRLNMSLRDIKRIDFDPNITPKTVLLMARVTTNKGYTLHIPADTLEFGAFSGYGMGWGDKLPLASGRTIPFSEIRSINILSVVDVIGEHLYTKEAVIVIVLMSDMVLEDKIIESRPALRGPSDTGPFILSIGDVQRVEFQR